MTKWERAMLSMTFAMVAGEVAAKLLVLFVRLQGG